MPVEPVIDLASIDLSATAVDQEGVARLIPHRGEVLQIDRIIWHDAAPDFGVAVKRVRHDEFWIGGHIPGMPLMPGVLMIEAGAQLASWMYYKRSGLEWFAGFTRIEDTSFRGHVTPGQDLLLLCKCLKYSPKRFVCLCQGVVEDEMVFESRVTGMTFPKLGPVRRTPLDVPAGRT